MSETLRVTSPTAVWTYLVPDHYTTGEPCWIARRSDVEEIGIIGYGTTQSIALARLATVLEMCGLSEPEEKHDAA